MSSVPGILIYLITGQLGKAVINSASCASEAIASFRNDNRPVLMGCGFSEKVLVENTELEGSFYLLPLITIDNTTLASSSSSENVSHFFRPKNINSLFRRLRALHRSMPDMCYWHSLSHEWLPVNPASRRLRMVF